MLTVLCLILIISSKNCHEVSTALQLCGYPPWSIATATTPSLTPRTDQKSTQVYLLQKVIYCARASRTKMASPRFFKESLRSVEFTFSLNPSHQLCQRLVRPKDEIVAEEKFGVIVMQSTTVKQQGHWAQGLNDLNEHRKSVHACDLKSAVSEHAKDAGHSIDEISVKIIGQENHLMPLRKIREAIDIHNLQPDMNRDQGYNLSPIYGTILQPHQNEAANNSERHH